MPRKIDDYFVPIYLAGKEKDKDNYYPSLIEMNPPENRSGTTISFLSLYAAAGLIHNLKEKENAIIIFTKNMEIPEKITTMNKITGQQIYSLEKNVNPESIKTIIDRIKEQLDPVKQNRVYVPKRIIKQFSIKEIKEISYYYRQISGKSFKDLETASLFKCLL